VLNQNIHFILKVNVWHALFVLPLWRINLWKPTSTFELCRHGGRPDALFTYFFCCEQMYRGTYSWRFMWYY